MNLLFLSNWYPNSRFIYQGIFIKKHAQAIKSAGVNIKVVALVFGSSNKLLENKTKFFVDENGIDTLLIEFNSWFYKLFSFNLLFMKLIVHFYVRKYMHDFKPNVIHSNVLFPSAVIGNEIALKLKIPFVMTEHWSKVNYYLEHGFYRRKARMAIDNLSMIMPVSDYLANKLMPFVSKNKIHVVPNAVDSSIFNYQEKYSNDRLELVCVANWEFPKRPDILFHSIESYVVNCRADVFLNVIGNGSLIDIEKEKKWSFSIKYHGFLNSHECVEVFRSSAYLLHASDSETFSVVLAEAISCGLPVIASKVGGIVELINEDNGILVENKIDEWVRALEEIQMIHFDRKSISDKMKNKVSLKVVGTEYLNIYKKVIENSN